MNEISNNLIAAGAGVLGAGLSMVAYVETNPKFMKMEPKVSPYNYRSEGIETANVKEYRKIIADRKAFDPVMKIWYKLNQSDILQYKGHIKRVYKYFFKNLGVLGYTKAILGGASAGIAVYQVGKYLINSMQK